MSEEWPVPLRWLTPEQAGDYVKLSAKTLERLRAEGRGPRVHIAGRKIVRYDIADLDRWLRGDRQEATA